MREGVESCFVGAERVKESNERFRRKGAEEAKRRKEGRHRRKERGRRKQEDRREAGDGRKKRHRRQQINTQKKTQQLQYRQIDREDDINSQVLVEFRT
jgi:hypothetical protein